MVAITKRPSECTELLYCHQCGCSNPTEEAIIRKAAARIAIFRKLKDLGHTDERIVNVYRKSLRDN
jgi:hypothetical protein